MKNMNITEGFLRDVGAAENAVPYIGAEHGALNAKLAQHRVR